MILGSDWQKLGNLVNELLIRGKGMAHALLKATVPMRCFLPSFIWPFLVSWFLLGGGAVVVQGQEEEPPVDEEPAEEVEEPPPEPLEKLVLIEAHVDGVSGVDGLDGAYDMKLSSDGAFLYVASMNDDAISIFSRDKETGALIFVSRTKNGENGVEGLKGARSLDLSPDGKNLYVVSMFDDALVSFSSDEFSGALTYEGRIKDGEFGVDGKFLYVAAFFDDAITVLSRDVDTGELVYDQSIFNTEEGVEGLNGTLTVMASPDGEHVYSTSISEKSLVVFRREIIIDPPVFTVEPLSKSIPANSSVSFNALAEGIDVVYQWKADGIDVAGANDPTLVIDPVSFGLGGTAYTVAASNDGGTVISADAVLTVLPEITLETSGADCVDAVEQHCVDRMARY